MQLSEKRKGKKSTNLLFQGEMKQLNIELRGFATAIGRGFLVLLSAIDTLGAKRLRLVRWMVWEAMLLLPK